VAVRELVVIVLAVMELVAALSMITLDAWILMIPEVVSKRPDELEIVLVANRLVR